MIYFSIKEVENTNEFTATISDIKPTDALLFMSFPTNGGRPLSELQAVLNDGLKHRTDKTSFQQTFNIVLAMRDSMTGPLIMQRLDAVAAQQEELSKTPLSKNK